MLIHNSNDLSDETLLETGNIRQTTSPHQFHDEVVPVFVAFGFNELFVFLIFEGLVNDLLTNLVGILKLSKTLNGADEEGRETCARLVSFLECVVSFEEDS